MALHQLFPEPLYSSKLERALTNEELKTIDAYKANHSSLELKVNKYNIFNATSWWYPVQTGDVILFPSTLNHGVDKKKGTNTRISLSFNTFIKGKLGENANLTELVLE